MHTHTIIIEKGPLGLSRSNSRLVLRWQPEKSHSLFRVNRNDPNPNDSFRNSFSQFFATNRSCKHQEKRYLIYKNTLSPEVSNKRTWLFSYFTQKIHPALPCLFFDHHPLTVNLISHFPLFVLIIFSAFFLIFQKNTQFFQISSKLFRIKNFCAFLGFRKKMHYVYV